jgi:hypothetical protein
LVSSAFLLTVAREKGDGIMKGKLMMMTTMGLLFLFFLSNVSEAVPGGIPDCTNNLNMCSTNLGASTNNLNMCTTNLEVCTANLINAQTDLSACQETVEDCTLKAWSRKLDCTSIANCPRFKVLSDLNNEAVLDRETCLVWEQRLKGWTSVWHANLCNYPIGGRYGWRLPTLQELMSLIDPTQSNPALPPGHPFNFQGVPMSFFWSATHSNNNYFDSIWGVNFETGVNSWVPGDYSRQWWCVRGGQQGVDSLGSYK